jgi:hypothetical protein
MQEAKKVDLVIATPGHSLMGGYVKSLIDTVAELSNRGISWAFSNAYESHVADARETTLSGTKDNSVLENRPFQGLLNYKKILWIDSDIVWTPEDVIKLYESDKDIVSGAYLLASGEVTAYPVALKRALTYDEVLPMTELMKVGAIGFGFVCIKQGVFESLSRPWFQSAITTLTVDGKDFTFPIIGEDISFCERARANGYDIWFDPTVRVTHHKTMRLTWEGIKP